MSFFDKHPEFDRNSKNQPRYSNEGRLKAKRLKGEEISISKRQRILSHLTIRDKSQDFICLFCGVDDPDVLMGVCANCVTLPVHQLIAEKV